MLQEHLRIAPGQRLDDARPRDRAKTVGERELVTPVEPHRFEDAVRDHLLDDAPARLGRQAQVLDERTEANRRARRRFLRHALEHAVGGVAQRERVEAEIQVLRDQGHRLHGESPVGRRGKLTISERLSLADRPGSGGPTLVQ